MALQKMYEGTWEELATHAEELRGYPKLTLIVALPEAGWQSGYRADLTPEARIRALDAAAEKTTIYRY